MGGHCTIHVKKDSDMDQDYRKRGGEEQSDLRHSLKIDTAGFWTDWVKIVRK